MAIKLEKSAVEMTSLGGLHLFDEIFKSFGMRERLREILPSFAAQAVPAFEKFRALTLGFVGGAECLDDMDDLAEDPGFSAICKKTTTAYVYGNFLRRFEPWQARKLNELLSDMAFRSRKALFPDDHNFILDVDSTSHQQYGKKMEGVGFNYDHVRCLDSLQAFDQYGFQHWIEVRPGGTFTSNGVPTVIDRVFYRVPRRMKRYLRADSGMCNADTFNACLQRNISFVICMRQNMYEPLLKRVFQWRRAKNIYFKDGRECEIGTTLYRNRHGDEALRVVVIRAPKAQRDLFGDGYDYRAWITNLGEHEMTHEDVINFYKGRGNAENFIRELKNGFDIHHFPCQSLLANRIYGLIAAFAYNLMRIAGWNVDKKKARFSKMTRFRMVYLAASVVKKSRQIIIRLSPRHHKEVSFWLTAIKQQLGTG